LLRYIKLIAPAAKALKLMPDFYVITENELTTKITNSGFDIERKWSHNSDGIKVFIIARKSNSD